MGMNAFMAIKKNRERKREIAIPKYMSTYILKENFIED